MAELDRKNNPYTYALNNPLRFIDIDGMYAGETGTYNRDDKDFDEVLAYFGIGQSKLQNQDDDEKSGINERGGTNDKYGDGGKVKYRGKAWFGTNFIGPGSDVDPRDLDLEPLDMIDQAAFEHDLSYYQYKSSGTKGALWDLKVIEADKKLEKDARNIIRQYKKGGTDPVTGERISERTYNVAKLVYAAFSQINNEKMIRNAVPSTVETMRVEFNGFINSVKASIPFYH